MATPICNLLANLSCETPTQAPQAESPHNDSPDDNFEVALGSAFRNCNTRQIREQRYQQIPPQYLSKITPYSSIHSHLRSIRLATLHQRAARIRATADRDRAKIALVHSDKYRGTLAKRAFHRRIRSDRPSKHGVQPPKHPAIHKSAKSAKPRSQSLPPPQPKVKSFKAPRRSLPFRDEIELDPFMLFPEWDWPVSPLKADSAQYIREAQEALQAIKHVRSKRSRFDASPTLADKLRVIQSSQPLSQSDTPKYSPRPDRTGFCFSQMDLSW